MTDVLDARTDYDRAMRLGLWIVAAVVLIALGTRYASNGGSDPWLIPGAIGAVIFLGGIAVLFGRDRDHK